MKGRVGAGPGEGGHAAYSIQVGAVRGVRVVGDIDVEAVNPLADAAADALRLHDGPIVFDLSRVTFCDSTLLNCLLQTRMRRTVWLIGVTEQTRRLLDITGTDSLFDYYASVQDAAAALS
ncbi:STAS domain-containing protein [Streptomyces sp. SGAir0957]